MRRCKKSIDGGGGGGGVGSYCGWSGGYREYKVMSCYPGPSTVQSSQTSQTLSTDINPSQITQ